MKLKMNKNRKLGKEKSGQDPGNMRAFINEVNRLAILLPKTINYLNEIKIY
ncbi:hypothetical protein ATK78_3846 [Pedobacter metabolipauper]|uniref:Uncharacterized protein n=1 Tax=Pedobacter metabolipauper TaxID=425513 RepID=A0A4R6SVC8_9SPHI|nr:hypothetical protein ATK78_3846 [Pedobacter metabolipauper]